MAKTLIITHCWKWLVGRFGAAAIAALLLALPATHAQEQDKLELDKIPKTVMDALKAKFPQAEIRKCTKEKEGDIIVYDIEFTQNEQKLEADIKEDGTIHNWEKQITAKQCPKAVKRAAKKAYPKSTFKEIMEITAVTDGKDALEGYEIVLETADKKVLELMLAPDGKIVEESAGEN